MTESLENLILEQRRGLRHQTAGLETEMRDEFSDMKQRINRLESAGAGIRRDEAGTAEEIARQQSPIERIKELVGRIERRLALASDGAS